MCTIWILCSGLSYCMRCFCADIHIATEILPRSRLIGIILFFIWIILWLWIAGTMKRCEPRTWFLEKWKFVCNSRWKNGGNMLNRKIDGSVSSSVSGAGPSVKHYFRITFPRKTYNRLIEKNLRNNGEICRWWPSIPKDHNPAPENSQRQGWTKIDKIDVNWKIESIPVWLTLYYFNLTFIFVKISQIKLFSYAFGVFIRKFSIF